MMMEKKAQITLFMILGISIVAILLLMTFIFLQSSTEGIALEFDRFDSLTTSLQQEFDVCVRDTLVNSTLLIMSQGGYRTPPDLLSFYDTSLWFRKHVNHQPTLNEIRSELERTIEEKIESCIDEGYYEGLGLSIIRSQPVAEVRFGESNINLLLDQRLTLRSGDYERVYDIHEASVNIRFRRMFEMATQINTRQNSMHFSIHDPLREVDEFDMEVSFESTEDGIIFTVHDPLSTEMGSRYEFTFGAVHGYSELSRTIELHDRSSRVPIHFPTTVTSADRMTQLHLMPGVLISYYGLNVDEIRVSTRHDSEARRNIPVEVEGTQILRTENKVWPLSTPVYIFEPHGVAFNTPQRLTLYYRDDFVDDPENIGVLYRDGLGGEWTPIPSAVIPEENVVYTDIVGFSEFATVDCSQSPATTVRVTSRMSSSGMCFVTLLAIIVIMVVMITVFAAAGGILGGATGAGTTGLAAAGPGAFWSTIGMNLGMLSTSALTAGSILATTLIWTGAIVGGAMINAQISFSADEDLVGFTPCHTQNIQLIGEASSGRGTCILVQGMDNHHTFSAGSSHRVQGGELTMLKAVTRKCSGFKRYTCGSCSMQCSATFK